MPISQKAIDLGLSSFEELLHFVRHLPYGRTSDRTNPIQVLTELKGTCSSKHALIKMIAHEQGFHNVHLYLGIYKMNRNNTPGIGNTLLEYHLSYLPEAHCYLEIDKKRVDLTNADSTFDRVRKDILDEEEIQPKQIGNYKEKYHKRFLKYWIEQTRVPYDLKDIWAIREMCIRKLSQATNLI
jgi:hypothetical protein